MSLGIGRTMKAVVLVAALVTSQGSPADDFTAIDPVVVSPGLYEIVLENEHVRVVRYQIEAGERDEWHTHPAKVSIVTSGGSLRITTVEGESFDVVEEQKGTVNETIGDAFMAVFEAGPLEENARQAVR